MNFQSFFFYNRSYTPIPIVITIIYFSNIQKPFFLLGLILILVGEIIRLHAVSYAGGKTRTRNVGASSLCTSGPYSRTRNPLYIGNMIIYFGVVFFSGGPLILELTLIVLIFFSIQYSFIISLEEKKLIELFKNEYINYQKNVPAIIPRLHPWKSSDNRIPYTIRQTIKIEKRTLQNIFLIVSCIISKSLFF